jgi:hypothetical protein
VMARLEPGAEALGRERHRIRRRHPDDAEPERPGAVEEGLLQGLRAQKSRSA